jgi:hypothetical protein
MTGTCRHTTLTPPLPQSIVFNGNVYKSLADHDPHSRTAIDEDGRFFNLNSAWEICPKTRDALHVCAAYPWGTHALCFADGSSHWTSLGSTISPSIQAGMRKIERIRY